MRYACYISNTAKVKKFYLTDKNDVQYHYVMTRENGESREAHEWYE